MQGRTHTHTHTHRVSARCAMAECDVCEVLYVSAFMRYEVHLGKTNGINKASHDGQVLPTILPRWSPPHCGWSPILHVYPHVPSATYVTYGQTLCDPWWSPFWAG